MSKYIIVIAAIGLYCAMLLTATTSSALGIS